MNSYSNLAFFYEYLFTDFDYDKWAKKVCDIVKKHASDIKGADFGCGTGIITRALKKEGFDVVGCDISNEMLSAAVEESEDLGIEYLNMDISAIAGLSDLGFITAINDCVNYLSPKKMDRAFKKVYSALKEGGVFVFDISTEYKLKQIIGNNTFCEDTERVSYIWFNSLKKDRVEMDLVFFVKDGEAYKRAEESHTQYIHSAFDVETSLKNAGFSNIKAIDIFGGKLTEKSERITFVVKK